MLLQNPIPHETTFLIPSSGNTSIVSAHSKEFVARKSVTHYREATQYQNPQRVTENPANTG